MACRAVPRARTCRRRSLDTEERVWGVLQSYCKLCAARRTPRHRVPRAAARRPHRTAPPHAPPCRRRARSNPRPRRPCTSATSALARGLAARTLAHSCCLTRRRPPPVAARAVRWVVRAALISRRRRARRRAARWLCRSAVAHTRTIPGGLAGAEERALPRTHTVSPVAWMCALLSARRLLPQFRAEKKRVLSELEGRLQLVQARSRKAKRVLPL
eukprot:2802305-Prymnesium_polylepis.1